MVSEKAANIARAIRQEEHLLSLLIQEKKDSEKNPRFAHDFKTLADVLVQEVVKHDLGKEVLFTCRGVCVRGAWLGRSTAVSSHHFSAPSTSFYIKLAI